MVQRMFPSYLHNPNLWLKRPPPLTWTGNGPFEARSNHAVRRHSPLQSTNARARAMHH